VDVWDTATRAVSTLPDEMWREQAPSPYGWIVSPCWSDDSTALAFRVDFDGYPGEVFVARFTGDAGGGAAAIVKVERPGEVSVDGTMAWRPGSGELCFLAEDRARCRVYADAGLDDGRQGRTAVLTPGDVAVEAFSFTPDGERMSFIRSGLEHPGDVFLGEPRRPGRETRLTRINPQVDTWKIPSIRIVEWTAPDGTTVEGILELPFGHEPGAGAAPLPMVVEIHGGPTSATRFTFQYWIYGRTIYPARGWALLSPNYRGSTGYGDRFLRDLIGRENDVEVADILAGVDAMVERGVADPQRLAVTGWSNGGYLTNCLIARDDRFKAASTGAGVLDMAMQWGTEDTPGHVINYAKGHPWTVPDEMRRMSPLYDAHKIRTATVIHVGEDDERVPAVHSRALHRALYRYLDVPCELIVYPGAGHGLTKYSHRKAKLEWDLAWFDKYVLESGE
jgi:dipeptidyl aminopeptidase/acylaminoacyl peptidase